MNGTNYHLFFIDVNNIIEGTSTINVVMCF